MITQETKNNRVLPRSSILFGIGLTILLLFFTTSFVLAAPSLTVNPVVIDKKAKARDILKESLTLTNNTGRKLNVYTFVNNIIASKGEEDFLDPSRADYSSSLANWVKISRGVIELSPGEKRTIDLRIDVNLRAKAGIYHAVISFVEGSSRAIAGEKLKSAPKVTVNLEVIEDIKERLQLGTFVPVKTFFSGSPITLLFSLENIGNRSLVPSGEIRIYNRRGEEVATIDVNDERLTLEPDGTVQLASVWQGVQGFGKYKAFLDLEYGTTQRGTIHDAAFFWVIPWQKILIIFVVLALSVILITYFWHRRYEKRRN